jgi:hypothetical protein
VQLGELVPHHDEPIRRRIRKRPQQDGVDYGEDRGVGSDPERKRENRGEGEAGRFEKASKGVAKIG